VPVIGQLEAAGVAQPLKPSFAASPARSTIRANPAVVNGAPRSDVNTKGFGILLSLRGRKEQQNQCWSYN
jgi:hypothetical protein